MDVAKKNKYGNKSYPENSLMKQLVVPVNSNTGNQLININLMAVPMV